MNRFDDLLNAVKVGESFTLTAGNVGMDGKSFDEFVDTILHAPRERFRASHPHKDSDGPHRYDAILITRTA
jgi:hypothetical protein